MQSLFLSPTLFPSSKYSLVFVLFNFVIESIMGTLYVFMHLSILTGIFPFVLFRAVFRNSKSAMGWVQRSKYFHLLARGVERDGWRFVLLARFSPLPSYVINYALAATKVGFLIDFLLPTVVGCLPMILQNTSIGSLAGVAVASSTSSKKSQIYSYLFPLLGIVSSILISLKIKKYSSGFAVAEEVNQSLSSENGDEGDNAVHSSSNKQVSGNAIKRK